MSAGLPPGICGFQAHEVSLKARNITISRWSFAEFLLSGSFILQRDRASLFMPQGSLQSRQDDAQKGLCVGVEMTEARIAATTSQELRAEIARSGG